MSGPMSVSMTVRIIDEATGAMRGITSAARELKDASDALNTSGSATRAGEWAVEKDAVRGVLAEVKALGDAGQNVGGIDAASAAYRAEAGAMQSVVDLAGALKIATVDAAAPIGDAVGKLHEEAAAIDGVIGKMRELGQASRAAVRPVPPPGGPSLTDMARGAAPDPVDWGAQAGKNRDWNAYWASKHGLPPEEEAPSAIHAAPSHEPEAPRTVKEAANPPTVATGGGGLISMIVGGAELGTGLRLIKGSYHEAADAAGQREAMRAAGIPEGEAGELASAATRVSREKRVFSENEVLDVARDARTILGSTPHAVEALPKIIDLATLAEAQRPGEGREGVLSLLKGMETSGATISPERFSELSQSLAKVTNVFGKTIGFADWGQYFKYGGTAAQHVSPEFTEQKVPHLIQELGGASTGTMLQSMERAIVAGRMDKGAREEMQRYGLYDPDTKKVKGADVFMRDPSEWVTSVLKPNMDAAHLSEDERLAAEDKMFSSRLAARGMSILENQDVNVQKNAAQIRAARGLEAAPDLARSDPALVARAAAAQSGNFERRAGEPAMSPLIALENTYSTALGGLNGMFDKVPGAATTAAAGIVGGAGYLGWKTWESGLGNTVKSVLRLPEGAGRGLIQGIREGVAEARAEVGSGRPTGLGPSNGQPDAASPAQPLRATDAGSVQPPPTTDAGPAQPPRATEAGPAQPPRATDMAPAQPVEGLRTVTEAASGTAAKFAEVSADVGTIGLMIASASKSDIVLDRHIAPSSLAQNPLGIALPGDPGSPAPPKLAPSTMPEMHELTEALREQARRSADAFRRQPEAARGYAMADLARQTDAAAPSVTAEAIRGALAPLQAGIQSAVAAAIRPQPVPTAAQPPQNVVNNDQKYVSAPITVNAPVTINATLNNTTPGAIANTVAGAVREGVRAGSAALHDGTETR